MPQGSSAAGSAPRWSAKQLAVVVAAVAAGSLLLELLRLGAARYLPVVPDAEPALLRYRAIPFALNAAAAGVTTALLLVGLGFSRTPAMRAALGLVLVGSLGNNLERALAGTVTTYVQLAPGWPFVNLADVMISVGAVMLFWLLGSAVVRAVREKMG